MKFVRELEREIENMIDEAQTAQAAQSRAAKKLRNERKPKMRLRNRASFEACLNLKGENGKLIKRYFKAFTAQAAFGLAWKSGKLSEYSVWHVSVVG